MSSPSRLSNSRSSAINALPASVELSHQAPQHQACRPAQESCHRLFAVPLQCSPGAAEVAKTYPVMASVMAIRSEVFGSCVVE